MSDLSSDSDDDERQLLHAKYDKDVGCKTHESFIQHCYYCESSTTSDSDDADEVKYDDDNILDHCSDEDDSLLVILQWNWDDNDIMPIQHTHTTCWTVEK